MLLELVVENFAVVEKLRLRFHEGLNVLTGETGSGKSLVVDALGLLLGGRGSTDLIRTGAPRAFAGGIFELPSGTHFSGWLEENSITAEDGELLIEREILANGKSRAFAGGRPVTAAFLRGLAPHLGDIHGQHDQQQLFDPGSQLGILDESGSIAREEVRSRFRAWRDAVARLNELDRNEKDKLRLADLWNMQRNEIEGASPAPGEDASLENERRVLKNVAKLQENASAAFEALSDAPESAAANLRAALKRIEELARIDANLKALLETLRPAQIAIDDVSHELRHYLGSLEADPGRLEHVESRLALIDRLKKKYGATIEEVLEFLAGVTRQLSALENSAQRRAELTLEAERLEQEFRAEAARLTALRTKVGLRLERQVESELSGLGMKGTVFRIGIAEAAPSDTGIDSVEFLVSANAGEEPRPLSKVASGGELSRIALALKTCATTSSAGRTLVFDEVDAGVGGAAAEMVGRRLRQIAASNQVLCVTHLAQIAGFAGHHYVVEKREIGGRTVSAVRELDAGDRPREIARMLSGKHLSEEALRHAERLIEEYNAAATRPR